MSHSNNEEWTIKKVLDWSEGFLNRKGVESPRVDVELLLARATGLKRIALYIQFDKVLGKEELARFKELLLRRSRREPTAYILGDREFYGIEFKVDRRVLIPRPETEHLIDRVLEEYKRSSEKRTILDIGTGSGNIAVAIAANLTCAEVVSVDSSQDALDVATENVRKAGLENRITLLKGDLFSSLSAAREGSFDAVVSNPPYVEEHYKKEMQPEVMNYEPHSALFAGELGLNIYEKLIPESARWLKPGGIILLEIGMGQATAVKSMLSNAGYSEIEFIKDYSGIDRIAYARKNHG